MRYLVTAQEMKQYDKNTIEYLGSPGAGSDGKSGSGCGGFSERAL